MTSHFDFCAHEDLFRTLFLGLDPYPYRVSHPCLLSLLKRFVRDEDPKLRARALAFPAVRACEEAVEPMLAALREEYNGFESAAWRSAWRLAPEALRERVHATPMTKVAATSATIPLIVKLQTDPEEAEEFLSDRMKSKRPAMYFVALHPSPSKQILARVLQMMKRKHDLEAAGALFLMGHAKALEWLADEENVLALQDANKNGGVFELLGDSSNELLDRILLDPTHPVNRQGLYRVACERGLWSEAHEDAFVETVRSNPRPVDWVSYHEEFPILGRARVNTLEALYAEGNEVAGRALLGQDSTAVEVPQNMTRPWAEDPEVTAARLEDLSSLNGFSGRRLAIMRDAERGRAILASIVQSDNPLTRLFWHFAQAEPNVHEDGSYVARLFDDYRTFHGATPEVAAPDAPRLVDLSSNAGFVRARERLREPAVAAEVRELAQTEKGKARKLAKALLERLAGRDPRIVALEGEARALLEVHREVVETLMTRFRNERTLDLGEVLQEHGEQVLAALAAAAGDAFWEQSSPSPASFPRSSEAASELASYALAKLTIHSPTMSQVLADEARFRGIDEYRVKNSLDRLYLAESEAMVPLGLEALAASPRHRKFAEKLLLGHQRQAAAEGLKEFLCRPSHAPAAAAFAKRARWRELAPHLESALATKPAAKVRRALEDALTACGGPTEAAPAEDSMAATLEALSKSRRKVPAPALTVAYADGTPLSERAVNGLWIALMSLGDVDRKGTPGLAMAALHADSREAVVEHVFAMPLSGKAKETWAIFARAFGDRARLDAIAWNFDALGAESASLAEVLTKLLGGVTKLDGVGAPYLALWRTARKDSARGQYAREALDPVVARARTKDDSATETSLYEDALAAAGADWTAATQDWLRAMIALGRTWSPSELKAWLAHAHIADAASGLVWHQGSTVFAWPYLPSDASTPISLAHPAALDDAQMQAGAALASGAWDQLSRRFARITYNELQAEIRSNTGVMPAGWVGRLAQRGYEDGEFFYDSNAVVSVVRRLGPAMITIGHEGPPDPKEMLGMNESTQWGATDALRSEMYIDLQVALGKQPGARPSSPTEG